jgi:hypothetical protein
VADPSRYSDSKSDTRGLPGWLKVSAIVIAILALLMVSMMLLGGGQGIHVPRPH